MGIINKNIGSPDGETLSVFCVENIGVRARVTFDSVENKKLKVAFWMEDDDELEEKLNGMFSILFDSMFKTKKDESLEDSIISNN